MKFISLLIFSLTLISVSSTFAQDDSINGISQEYVDQSISPDAMLDDKLNLIPQDFKIPEGLKQRVGFWFDIYTRFTSHFSVIHDATSPWIVYQVVDLREIYNQNTNRYKKDAADHHAIAKARNEVRRILLNLSKKRSYANLSPDEYKFYKLLEPVPGKRHAVFRRAAFNLRAQRGQKDFYRNGLIASSKYLNEMEKIFAKYDLPVELVRLPLVESSFNEGAQSKVGASGIWQFMVGTGKRYLTVGRIYDERNSPIKATEAAAKLMLSNFRTVHTWPLAITSYNHGAGGVLKAVRRLHTTSIVDIIGKYHSGAFSFASQNFYCEYLAALYGEKYQDKIFGQMPKYPPLAAETIDLEYSMRARSLTEMVGLTVEELKLYNPDLKAQAIAGGTYLPAGYHVRLPPGKKEIVEEFNKEAVEARDFVNRELRKNRFRVLEAAKTRS